MKALLFPPKCRTFACKPEEKVTGTWQSYSSYCIFQKLIKFVPERQTCLLTGHDSPQSNLRLREEQGKELEIKLAITFFHFFLIKNIGLPK